MSSFFVFLDFSSNAMILFSLSFQIFYFLPKFTRSTLMNFYILNFSVQLYRPRKMRHQCDNTLFWYRTMPDQKSSSSLLVGTDAPQAKILHRLPQATR
jgi:hypothetical protein